MSWFDIAVASLTVLVGATLQGSVGFGMGLLASPILILLDPRFVPAPILLSTLVLVTLLTYRERHAIDLYGLRWAVLGRMIGTVAAAGVLLVVPADRLVLVFGALILIGIVMSMSGLRFVPARRAFVPARRVLVAAGALSGVMGTVASIGGPPMALVYQDASGARVRSTMSGFFFIGTIVSLVALRLVGRFGMYEVRLALIMLPSLLAGYVLSHWTAGLVDRGYTRRAVLVVAGAAGVAVVVRQMV